MYIHNEDDSWDHARIKRECDAMEKEAKGSSESHPVRLYQRGETRGDLRAPSSYGGAACTVLDYVKIADAWRFNFGRLASADYARVQDLMVGGTASLAAFELAARLSWHPSEGEDVYESIDDMHANDPDLVYALGVFAFKCSQPLSEPEKKPKAAGVGDPVA